MITQPLRLGRLLPGSHFRLIAGPSSHVCPLCLIYCWSDSARLFLKGKTIFRWFGLAEPLWCFTLWCYIRYVHAPILSPDYRECLAPIGLLCRMFLIARFLAETSTGSNITHVTVKRPFPRPDFMPLMFPFAENYFQFYHQWRWLELLPVLCWEPLPVLWTVEMGRTIASLGGDGSTRDYSDLRTNDPTACSANLPCSERSQI